MARFFSLLKNIIGVHDASVSISGKKVDEAVERVIDGIDARLRLVPSYQQKLHAAVSTALDHIDRLVDRVPGPVDMSRRAFTSSPTVRSYFASPDALQDIFINSAELQDYYSNINNCESDTCYALMCTNKQEKSLVGSGLVNDVVRHDLLQTSVNFFDHKVLSPAASAEEVRQGVKQCIFDGLITHALLHIAGIKARRRDLQDQQRILYSQLRTRQARGNGLSAMLAESYQNHVNSDDIEQQYQQTGQQLEQMLDKQDVLTFYLEEIRKILARPEEFIRLKESCFQLNDMGIKVEGSAPQTSSTVCFSEIEIANVMKRVVTVVSYHRAEMERINNS